MVIARPKWLKLETRMAEAGGGVTGEGAASPPSPTPPARGSVSSPVGSQPLLILIWFEAPKLCLIISLASRLGVGGGRSPSWLPMDPPLVTYLTVIRTMIRNIWRPEVWRNEFRRFMLKELYQLTCTVCWNSLAQYSN